MIVSLKEALQLQLMGCSEGQTYAHAADDAVNCVLLSQIGWLLKSSIASVK
jgi:hypothetical protein